MSSTFVWLRCDTLPGLFFRSLFAEWILLSIYAWDDNKVPVFHVVYFRFLLCRADLPRKSKPGVSKACRILKL